MPRAAVVAPQGGLLVYPTLPACINTLQSPVRSANLPSVEAVPQVWCGKEVPPWYHLLNIRKHCAPPAPPPRPAPSQKHPSQPSIWDSLSLCLTFLKSYSSELNAIPFYSQSPKGI